MCRREFDFARVPRVSILRGCFGREKQLPFTARRLRRRFCLHLEEASCQRSETVDVKVSDRVVHA